MKFFFAFTLGSAFGSFLGVIIDRGLIFGRSRCGHCKHQLSWRENIPVLSYIFLRGRCRSCHVPIPYWLPLIELAGAVAAAAILSNLRNLSYLSILSQISIAVALIWIFFSDLVKGLIPDRAVVLGAIGAILSNLNSLSNLSYLGAAVGVALFFWLLAAATRGRGMGTGDITLAFFLGLWLGWPKIAIAVWLAFLIGAIVGLGLILLGRKKFGQTVPFGPFLIIGSLLAQQWGQAIVDILF